MVPAVAEHGGRMRLPFKWVKRNQPAFVRASLRAEVAAHTGSSHTLSGFIWQMFNWESQEILAARQEDSLWEKEWATAVGRHGVLLLWWTLPSLKRLKLLVGGAVNTVASSRTDPVSWKARRRYLYPRVGAGSGWRAGNSPESGSHTSAIRGLLPLD